MTKRSVLACSGILIAIAACGDNGSRPAGPDAAQTPDAAPDAAPVKPEGQIGVAELRSVVPTNDPISNVEATFLNGRVLPTIGTVDGCTVHANDPMPSLDAGSITVTGTTTPLTLVRKPDSIYLPAAEPPADLFTPGAQLTMTATGGTVPAFTGSVTAPAPLAQVVFPTAISRAAPPTITWAAGTADEVWVFMIAYVGANTGTVMICRTTDSGSFGITAGAFAQLPANASEAVIVLYRFNTTVVNAGAWAVSLVAFDGLFNEEVPINP